MSVDFLLLILALAGLLYATAVSLHLRRKLVLAMLAVLVAAFVCLHTFMLITLTGDGRILPGHQLSPNVKAILGESLATTPFPHAGFTFLILVAHALLWMQAPGRRGFWLPMPATLAFVGIFAAVQQRAGRGPIHHARWAGPGRAAYLTLVPVDGKKRTRIIISDGERKAWFCRVRVVHESGAPPPRPPPPRLFWTKDGKGLVLMVLRKMIFGVDTESGEVAGGLPEKGNEWPRHTAAAESIKAQMQLSRWRRAVETFVREHGGIYVR